MMLLMATGVAEFRVQLTDVLYSSQLGYTLISVAKINDARYSTTFMDGHCKICDKAGSIIVLWVPHFPSLLMLVDATHTMLPCLDPTLPPWSWPLITNYQTSIRILAVVLLSRQTW